MTRPTKLAWQKALRGAKELSHAEFRVLMIISTYTDGNLGNAFPGLDQIVADACVTEKTARKAIRSLREKGWLILTQEGGNQHGKGRANVYALDVPKRATEDIPGTFPEDSRNSRDKGGTEYREGGYSVPGKGGTEGDPIGSWTTSKNSSISVTPAGATPRLLPDNFAPNHSHRVQADNLDVDLPEALSEFTAQMRRAKATRTDWDKTFSAYLKECVIGGQHDVFPDDDPDEELSDYSCPRCGAQLPVNLYCTPCDKEYEVPA